MIIAVLYELCNYNTTITTQAVIDYQEATGDLKVDGIAGPKTRSAIVNKKRCNNIDPFAKNEVVDAEVNYAESDYAGKKEVQYYIGPHPGYLKRNDVIEVIKKATDQYGDNSSLSFSVVTEEEKADITFKWKMFPQEEDPMRFDGAGGALGRGGNGYVEFDLAERWVLGLDPDDKDLSDLFDPETWYRGQPTISLYYTALHEFGHCMGLVHSQNPNDVMSPWYNPKQTELSKNDIERLQAIVDA